MGIIVPWAAKAVTELNYSRQPTNAKQKEHNTSHCGAYHVCRRMEALLLFSRRFYRWFLECLRKAGPGGGYIVSSSNIIHEGVPPENYLAMTQTVKEFGREGGRHSADQQSPSS